LVGVFSLCLVVLVPELFVASRLLSEGTLIELLSREVGKNHYWSHACISADKTMLAAVGDEVARVERLATAYFNRVACLPGGRVLARGGVEDGLYAVHEARWLAVSLLS